MNYGFMAMKLKSSPIIPMEASTRAKTDESITSSSNGIMHQEFLLQVRTVNKQYALEVMCRLRQAICQKGTELWKNHYSAPAHI